MSHLHQSFLDEFKIAIDKMVALTPKEIIDEAKSLLSQLQEDENATEKQIHQAIAIIGQKEYPYRKAYDELCESDEEQRLQEAVFERLDEDVRKKVEEMTKNGVVLEEYVKSDLFDEQLEGDDRHQVEQAILIADEVLDNQCDERAQKRNVQYKDLVEKWKKEAGRLQGEIDKMRKLGEENIKWKTEIDSVADRLEEGWAVTNRDPEEEEIKKEMEYWVTVLNEGNEE